MLQNEGTAFAKGLGQTQDAWIFGRDAVGDGRGHPDDFLEHFDKGVIFVLAGFDLAVFHAEGGFEVHSSCSVVWMVSQGFCFGREKEGNGSACR